MPHFKYSFTVNAPRSDVLAFHQDTRALKTLTPPPIFVQLHHIEPLAEGSLTDFTLWFGPFPVRWEAVHSNVGVDGFTDSQRRGPLKYWKHRHHFTAVSDGMTEIHESIEYEHSGGIKGVASRILYSKAALYLLFTARKFITKLKLESSTSSVYAT